MKAVQMSFAGFGQSVANDAVPPSGLDAPLQALWLDARGDWARAHELAQVAGGRDGAWVHAYLHRKEGDEANASYWYGRAGRPAATGELAAEWRAIARELLGAPSSG
jgi:hypothetical protein